MKQIGKIRERMVASPLHLKTYLNSVFDPVTDETIDVTFHSFFWLIYAGIDEKDVMDITKDQIDFENMEIHHKTVNYPIYIEAVPALKKAISLTKFRYKHPMYDEKIVIFKDRLPGDKILRGITGDKDIFAMKNHIAHKTANAIKAGKSELRLSTNRAELSGIFHRLYDRERAGLPISFTEYAIRRVATNTPDVFKNKEEANRRIRKAERDYLNDYTRWKLAFSS